MKLRYLAAGVLLVLASFSMADAVDDGVTAGWSDGWRSAWAFSMIAGMIAGVFLTVAGLGLITRASLNEGREPGGRGLTPLHFGAVYAGSLLLVSGLALLLAERFGVDRERALVTIAGGTFLLASTGRPWWLLRTFRNVGWFADLGDRTIRVTLLVLGLVLLIGGLFAA